MPDDVTGFSRALAIELKFEGGKVDDPADPGGRTNQGITQRTYNAYRQRLGLQARDVYDMGNDERDAIYREQYWNLIHGDQLPAGVDFVTLDGAVNSGVSQGVKWLQAALGVNADGIIGPNTLHAVNDPNLDHDELIAKMISLREAFLKANKNFSRYGKGWMSRCLQVEQLGQAVATGAPHAEPTYVDGMHAKAHPDDMKKAPPRAVGDAATGGGLGSIGLSQVVNSLQDQLSPYSYTSAAVSKIVIGLIIVGAILTVGGIAWRLYALWKAGRIKEAQI